MGIAFILLIKKNYGRFLQTREQPRLLNPY